MEKQYLLTVLYKNSNRFDYWLLETIEEMELWLAKLGDTVHVMFCGKIKIIEEYKRDI